jgi:glutamate-ammonia-ligase adenylyltransferase
MPLRNTSLLKLIDSLPSGDALSDANWGSLGFRDPVRAKTSFAAISSRPGVAAAGREIIRALAASCDPDQALSLFEQWLEAGGEIPASASQFLNLLCMLFAATPALSRYFIRFPSRTQAVLDPVIQRKVAGGGAWRDEIETALKTATTYTAQLSALRRTRIELMLQIAALDLSGTSPFVDAVRALSDLADAFIEAALNIATQRARPRAPKSLPADGSIPFTIFALGKLGGRELNYSSDIDLVFAYGKLPSTAGENDEQTAYQRYFTAVGEELVTALDKVTDDGRVYRVDMRLRPYGTSGPLIRSVEETLNYFQTEGRTWERQAWLKARVCAGDRLIGGELLAELSPFIFRKYLSLDAISDMQALKRQIELSAERRGERGDEVKLGRGGIRDIEFSVQFMQLLHGSEFPRVRIGNTLRALDELAREKLLAQTEVELLSKAYVFLRNMEHRLQLHGDQQVHWLPADPVVRRRVALSMGYYDSGSQTVQEAFEADRQRHANATRGVFQRLFANLFQEHSGAEGELSDLLLAPQNDLPRIAALLPAFGFAQAEPSAQELVELSRESLALVAPSRTRKFFASIAPQLLKSLAATGEPDDALRRFSRIAGSLGAKAVFYQMLSENPSLLKMTVELAAWSEYLTDTLVANPGLFDELVDALHTERSKTAAVMQSELEMLTTGGDIADTLRAYRSGELLRIGVRDLLHSASLEQTQFELSDLAESILRIEVQHIARQHIQSRGEIKNAAGKPVRFAVLALGKFGGREMNYGSDLDVLYFYGEDGQTEAGLPAVSYFAELAQALTRAMARPTSLGMLYELDARLRPNGTKGPLAISIDDFKRYWKEGQLADWERLALTRVRWVAGDEAVGERALHMIRSAVYSPLKDTKTLSHEVANMRQKLEDQAESGDIKRGRGGIMDIEFTVQYLQLIHGPAFPPLRQANTEHALRTLLKFKKIGTEDGKALLQAYEFLRRIENRVRVVHGLSGHNLPNKPAALRKLALRAGYSDQESGRAEDLLQQDYSRHTQSAREIFERVVGK